ncbi:hypothetical protein HCG51_32885 [Tolypothrix sp. PCC 7910]|nr:hypothetical protein [Tolypothrix sp. PCC 7910]QIR41007.1 hypothetical protein HCG51_32885 [Tolypothrix sp. PCC 7910]
MSFITSLEVPTPFDNEGGQDARPTTFLERVLSQSSKRRLPALTTKDK